MNGGNARDIIDAFSGGTVFDKEPEEGDWWWVKFPAEILLTKVEVSYISPMIVTFGYPPLQSAYKRCDVDMVEVCTS